MNKALNKRIINEMQIITYLDAIKECTEVARGYINGEYKVNDVDELVVALSCIPDDIEEIKHLIYEINQNCEKEIREVEYERL